MLSFYIRSLFVDGSEEVVYIVVIHCDVDSVVPWAMGGVNPTITPDPFMDRERRCLSKLVCRDGTKLSQCLADLLGRLEAFILLALLR